MIPAGPFEGTWERPGKSPLAAAVCLILICGSLYYAVTTTAMVAVTVGAALRGERWAVPADFVATLRAYYRRFQSPTLVTLTFGQFAFFLALPIALFRRWHTRRVARYFGYRAPRVLHVALGAGGAVAVVPVAALLSGWVYFFFPVLRRLDEAATLLLEAPTPGRLAAVVLAVAVTPAVCEEALFRGYFQGTLRRRLAPAASIAISGSVFALFHRSPLALLALVLVGCYLGFVYERTGSLFSSMAAHFAYNLTVIGLANARASRLPRWLADPAAGPTFVVLAVSALAFAAAVWALLARAPASRRGPR
jgi:membrane protease YdiL (CAAX protease family)